MTTTGLDALVPASGDHGAITWSGFAWDNLSAVTLGNIAGGAGLVALVYRFIYLEGGTSD